MAWLLLAIWVIGMVCMLVTQYRDQSFDEAIDRLIGLVLCAAWPVLLVLVVLSRFNLLNIPNKVNK